MLRGFILIVLAVLAAGCVSTKNVPVSDEAMTSMNGKSLAVAKRDRPKFAAMTAGKAMFGLVGAAAMIEAGNRIVAENNVNDPAVYIANVLAADLARESGLVVDASLDAVTDSKDVAELAGEYQQYDYLLDVRTVDWSFGYFATDWNNYRVMYSAKLRLIDTRNRKVVAEGFCSRIPEKSDGAPSHEQLLANQAQLLKSELSLAAEHCITELGAKALMTSKRASGVSS